MAQCPLCAAQIPDEFGLIECAQCSAQLIVHMDGRVEYSGAKVVTGEISAVVPEEEFHFGDAGPDIDLEGAPTSQIHLDDDKTEIQGDVNFSSPEEPEAAPVVEPPPLPEEEPATEVYQAPTVQDSSDLSDIARFGNSDASSSRDGSLRYNLVISGIDTADVREAFREAITDRKLVWDIDQILRSMKNGEVKIANVPPPKAYILISRLRNLPVNVRWEQYAISQS